MENKILFSAVLHFVKKKALNIHYIYIFLLLKCIPIRKYHFNIIAVTEINKGNIYCV